MLRCAGALLAPGPAPWPSQLAAAVRRAASTAAASTAPPPPLAWAALMQAAVTPALGAALAARGWAVADGALPPALTAALRGEVDALRAAPGLTRPNRTHLVRPGGGAPTLLEKPRIVEAEITRDAAARAAAPLLAQARAGGAAGRRGPPPGGCAAAWRAGRLLHKPRAPSPRPTHARAHANAQIDADTTLAVLLSLFLPSLRLGGHGIKAQFNDGCAAGGGAFPIHTDSEEGLDARRVRRPRPPPRAAAPRGRTPRGRASRPSARAARRAARGQQGAPQSGGRPCPHPAQVTAIFYLNDGWEPRHGGVLRLYPWPEAPVDIEPLGGRLVLFSSTQMHHRRARRCGARGRLRRRALARAAPRPARRLA